MFFSIQNLIPFSLPLFHRNEIIQKPHEIDFFESAKKHGLIDDLHIIKEVIPAHNSEIDPHTLGKIMASLLANTHRLKKRFGRKALLFCPHALPINPEENFTRGSIEEVHYMERHRVARIPQYYHGCRHIQLFFEGMQSSNYVMYTCVSKMAHERPMVKLGI